MVCKISIKVGFPKEIVPYKFEEGKVSGCLLDHGFKVEEECNTETLEKRYFTSYEGTLLGHVNGTHSIVLTKLI
jgi:hypothetical protein